MGRITGKIVMAGFVAMAALAGCSPIIRNHGFVPTQNDLAAVQVGQATRENVISSFGPPTSEGALERDAFYYVSSRFRHFGPLAPEEVDRQVLAVSFDGAGVVSNIERFTLQDGRVVALDRRVTEDGINDVTFIGQLLGSFGRIDAGTLLGEAPQ